MRGIVRVKNSAGKTAGFIIDDEYINYFTLLKNIENEPRLMATKDGKIKSRKGVLKSISVREWNNINYQKLCKKSPIERDIVRELEYWRKYNSSQVLYLQGARQVGKTTELEKFAYRNYEQILMVNLAEDKKREAFERLVVNNVSVRYGIVNFCKEQGYAEYVNNSNTILILDEIQESYLAFNLIRTMNTNLKCHIVVTGSYLGHTLNSKFFQPAGTTYDLEMLPLSFREFCRVFKEENLLMNIDITGKSKKEEYERLTGLYRIYREIGGYPAVVREYVKSKNIDRCLRIIDNIIERFTDESARYFGFDGSDEYKSAKDKSELIFRNVYKAAAMNIASEKKGINKTGAKSIDITTRWVKESTKELISRGEVNKAISWLIYSEILGTCDLYNEGKVTEIIYDRRNYFKDNGILNCILRKTTLDSGTVNGILTENFAYTELYRLYKTNKVKGDKPCFSTLENCELDFMIVGNDDKVYGIEIKTSNSNNPISLKEYMDRRLINEAYLAGLTKGGIRQEIAEGVIYRSIPIYTVGVRFPYK